MNSRTNILAADNRITELNPAELSDMEKQSVIDLAIKVLAARHRRGSSLTSPKQTQDYLRLRMADYQNEVFGCLFLDSQHRIIDVAELFQGTINASAVYPRVVVQKALEANAAAVMFFHNHPSGISEPSIADETITRRLKEALSLVDISVLDHFVVAAGDSVSFAERGLI